MGSKWMPVSLILGAVPCRPSPTLPPTHCLSEISMTLLCPQLPRPTLVGVTPSWLVLVQDHCPLELLFHLGAELDPTGPSPDPESICVI